MLHTGAKAKLTKLNVNTDEKYARVRQSFGRIGGSLRMGFCLYPHSRFLGELETGSSNVEVVDRSIRWLGMVLSSLYGDEFNTR